MDNTYILKVRNPITGKFEHIESIKGKSAYTSAVDGGYTETEPQFYADLAKTTPTINTSGDITLADNTIYARNELSTLELPSITPELGYTSTVIFTSGETPTTVIDSTGAIWAGDGVVWDGDNEIYVFAPVAGKRYTLTLMYDGVMLRGYSWAVNV